MLLLIKRFDKWVILFSKQVLDSRQMQMGILMMGILILWRIITGLTPVLKLICTYP